MISFVLLFKMRNQLSWQVFLTDSAAALRFKDRVAQRPFPNSASLAWLFHDTFRPFCTLLSFKDIFFGFVHFSTLFVVLQSIILSWFCFCSVFLAGLFSPCSGLAQWLFGLRIEQGANKD
jgi:hypothetical protein